jgi:nucleoside 2-deoxyribosyltransferase
MRIYIAGHDQEIARIIARQLESDGHYITSTWLDEEPFMAYDDPLIDVGVKAHIAINDLLEVKDSDAVVTFASRDKVTGGKFIEIGAAIASGLPVYLIGRQENMLMYHKNIIQVEDVQTVRSLLRKYL